MFFLKYHKTVQTHTHTHKQKTAIEGIKEIKRHVKIGKIGCNQGKYVYSMYSRSHRIAGVGKILV